MYPEIDSVLPRIVLRLDVQIPKHRRQVLQFLVRESMTQKTIYWPWEATHTRVPGQDGGSFLTFGIHTRSPSRFVAPAV